MNIHGVQFFFHSLPSTQAVPTTFYTNFTLEQLMRVYTSTVGEIEQVTTALDTEVSFKLELLSYLMVTCDFSITFPLKITFTLC